MDHSERNEAVAVDNVLDIALHRLEAHEAAGLTLQVVEQRRKGIEVLPAAATGTVVQCLLVCTRQPLKLANDATQRQSQGRLRVGEDKC